MPRSIALRKYIDFHRRTQYGKGTAGRGEDAAPGLIARLPGTRAAAGSGNASTGTP